MKNMRITFNRAAFVFVAVVILLALYQSSRFSYTLFHTMVEFITIVIGCGIFMLLWHSRRYFNNNYLLLVGIASLFISIVDFIHTLTYKGMGVLGTFNADFPPQLWIVARYMQSLSLLVAPFFLTRRLKAEVVFGFYTLITALLVASVFFGIFPECYVDGVGLTPFKKNSEYL